MSDTIKAPYRMNQAALAAQARIRSMGATYARALQPSFDRSDELVALLLAAIPERDAAKLKALLKKGVDAGRVIKGLKDGLGAAPEYARAPT